MKENGSTEWLEWARALLSIAQAGLTYSTNEFDLDRYRTVKDIAARIVSTGTAEPVRAVKDLFDQESGYQTPKIDVRGAVFKEGRILLVTEKLDDGKWTLPGGWGEVWDTPRTNVEREVFEEAGLKVHATKLAAVYDRKTQGHTPDFYNSYKLLFICEAVGGDLRESSETGTPRYFSKEELPKDEDLSLRRTRYKQLLKMFEHYEKPDLPTDFD